MIHNPVVEKNLLLYQKQNARTIGGNKACKILLAEK